MQIHEHHLAVLGMSFALAVIVGVGVIYSALPISGNVAPKIVTANVSNIPLPPPLPEPPASAMNGSENANDVATTSHSETAPTNIVPAS